MYFCTHFKILGRKICAWPFRTEATACAGQLSQDADPSVKGKCAEKGTSEPRRGTQKKLQPTRISHLMGGPAGRAGREGTAALPTATAGAGLPGCPAGGSSGRSSGTTSAPARSTERCPLPRRRLPSVTEADEPPSPSGPAPAAPA